jgi:hypothetical protein
MRESGRWSPAVLMAVSSSAQVVSKLEGVGFRRRRGGAAVSRQAPRNRTPSLVVQEASSDKSQTCSMTVGIEIRLATSSRISRGGRSSWRVSSLSWFPEGRFREGSQIGPKRLGSIGRARSNHQIGTTACPTPLSRRFYLLTLLVRRNSAVWPSVGPRARRPS